MTLEWQRAVYLFRMYHIGPWTQESLDAELRMWRAYVQQQMRFANGGDR